MLLFGVFRRSVGRSKSGGMSSMKIFVRNEAVYSDLLLNLNGTL